MSLLGQTIPPFALQDEHGQIITDQALRGTWTVLYAYPKDATPGCTREACDFRDRAERLISLGAQVIGLSKDSPASHARFAQTQNLGFTLLADPELVLLKPLGAFGTKTLYGKTSEGILRSTFLVDPQGVIRHIWPKVRVEGHADAVLNKLQELKAP